MSRLLYLRSLLQGNFLTDTKRLHEMYGDIVRIAPGELSFASKEAWHDIYEHRQGHKHLTKDEIWYKRQSDPIAILR